MKIKNIVSGLIAALFVTVTVAEVAALEFCGKMQMDSAAGVETIPTTSGHSAQNCPHHNRDNCPLDHSASYAGSETKVCYISKCPPLSSEKENGFLFRKDLTVRQISELPYPETDNFQTPYHWRTGTGRESIEPRPPTA